MSTSDRLTIETICDLIYAKAEPEWVLKAIAGDRNAQVDEDGFWFPTERPDEYRPSNIILNHICGAFRQEMARRAA